MNKLVSRKQLLIAESDLNRAQLLQDWHTMAAGVRSLAHRANWLATMASETALLVGGLATARHQSSVAARQKPSCLQTILRGARLACSIGLAFGQGREKKLS